MVQVDARQGDESRVRRGRLKFICKKTGLSVSQFVIQAGSPVSGLPTRRNEIRTRFRQVTEIILRVRRFERTTAEQTSHVLRDPRLRRGNRQHGRVTVTCDFFLSLGVSNLQNARAALVRFP